MVSNHVCYNGLGDVYLATRNQRRLTRNLVHRLERLGYTVTLEQKSRVKSASSARLSVIS